MAISLSTYRVVGGGYKDKFISFPSELNPETPIENGKIDAENSIVNFPDINNFNTTGVIESEIEYIGNTDVEMECSISKKNGLAYSNTLQLHKGSSFIIISDVESLTQNKVLVVYYGRLSQNVLNGSKYTTYEVQLAL